MNSINEIAKYKYEFNNNSPVNLDEYIILYDEALNEKYLLFKLYNSISETLKRVECQIKIYNENNFLIEDIKFSFDGEFQGTSYFVPENKLKVNSDITSIKFNVTYLEFETLKFENGEIKKIPLTLNDFMSAPENEVIPVKKQNKWTKKTDKLRYKTTKKNVKRDNKRKYITDVIKDHKTKIHIVWTVIFSIIVIGYFIASMLVYGITAKIKSDGVCDYITVGDSLTLMDNYKQTTSVNVPLAIDNAKVTKIARDAFRSNTTIQSLTLNYYVEVGESAFNGCSNLRQINNQQYITKIEKNAFKGSRIPNLIFTNCGYVAQDAFPDMLTNEIVLPKATLTANSLRGVTGVTSIEFQKLEAATTLYSVFGDVDVKTLKKVTTYNDILYTTLDGLTGINKVYLYGERNDSNTTMRSACLENGTLNYLRVYATSNKLQERLGVAKDYKFQTLHINSVNSNTNFLSNINAIKLVLENGTLDTYFIANAGNIDLLYIGKDVDCSRVDFSKLANSKVGTICFEGSIPQNAKNYISSSNANINRASMGIDD